MKLVDNTKEVWSHYSTSMLLFVAGAQGVWVTMPEAWLKAYPDWVAPMMSYVTGAAALLGLLGKFIKQALPSDAAKPADAPAPTP